MKIWRKIEMNSFRGSLVLSNAILALFPVILMGIISSYLIHDNAREMIYEANSVMFYQLNQRINTYFNTIKNVEENIFFNRETQSAIALYDETGDREVLSDRIVPKMRDMLRIDTNIKLVGLYTLGGKWAVEGQANNLPLSWKVLETCREVSATREGKGRTLFTFLELNGEYVVLYS